MTTLRWGSATDVGRVRSNNQDAVLTSDKLFVVADGMGGHRGGEVASELAVKSLRDDLVKPGDEVTTDALVRAVQQANEVVVKAASEDPDLAGMGTTLCAMSVVGDDNAHRLAIVNVGDSRVYLLKDGQLEQVTDDHSLVATLQRQGRISEAEAAVHPQRNILTRALGIDARVMVDSWEVRSVAGDRYVLCSDGLFNEVDEDRMAATLRRLAEPTEAAHELVRLANESGGRDNISIVIVDVLADDDAEASATVAVAGQADRVIAAVSGEARATGRDHRPDQPKPTRKERRAADKAARPPRPRRLTWRVVIFIVAVAAIIGATAAAITYYGRHTYYVGFDGKGQVVVFQGRPGGVLWMNAKPVEQTGLSRSTVPPDAVSDIEAGKIEPTLNDAHRYLANLTEESTERGRTGATTTTVPTTPASATSTTALALGFA